ncbi:MAG: hypothetical protein ABL932_26640, partial [Terricaulis sp.]
PSVQASTACARPGAPVVRLTVERGALVCSSDGRRRVLLRWQADRAGALSYSADGVAWRANWSDAAAPYVRFELRRGARVETSWAEHGMGAAP